MNEPTELQKFLGRHGARVRRAVAMQLLSISDAHTFQKVVDANPRIKHRLPGEGQWKYVTSVIFELLPKSSPECASVSVTGEGTKTNSHRAL